MYTEAIKAKMRDPAYLGLHLTAYSVMHQVGENKWYDAQFLRRYEVAKKYLAEVRPDALEEFEAAFAPLKPPADFKVTMLTDLFDAETHKRIIEVSRSIPQKDLELHEAGFFGRSVVHDHPYFLELQDDLLPRVCEIVGRDLVTGYNFLSLYGGTGRCDPHMDQPISMFTLDYCIEQSHEWPIYFSDIVDWPTADTIRHWDPSAVLNNPDIEFTPAVLQPNNALIFNGSSQWHYRDQITPGGFCSLLFFHYFPKGCENLVRPEKWTEQFDIPELGPLCDLFRQENFNEIN